MTSVVQLAHFNCSFRYSNFEVYISDLSVIILQNYLSFIQGHAFVHIFIHGRCVPDGLHNLSFAYHPGPSWVCSTRQMLLPFVSWQDWHSLLLHFIVCFTRCISTPWIFSCTVFSAVSDWESLLRDLLCSWGSFFFKVFDIFVRGYEVACESFQFITHNLATLSCMISLVISNIDISLWPSHRLSCSIIYWEFLLSLCLLWW